MGDEQEKVVSVVMIVGAYDHDGLCWIWAIPGEAAPMAEGTPRPEEHPDAIQVLGPCSSGFADRVFCGVEHLLTKLGFKVVVGYISDD